MMSAITRPAMLTAAAAGTLMLLTLSSPAAADPVAESFERMLDHEPTPLMAQAPAHLGLDPLMAAVVLPLQRARQQHGGTQVASAGSTAD